MFSITPARDARCECRVYPLTSPARWQGERTQTWPNRREPGQRVNAQQAAEWNGPAGAHRTRHAAVFDAETRPYHERFRAATGVTSRDRVLDVGCGTGQSTRDAARAAVAGSALGIDLSAQMLEHARRVSREERLANVVFEQADAQVHRFPAGGFDVAISRFGSMFFDDPVAAFGNIGRALRPGGRLVLMVWQARERNAWSTTIREAIAGDAELPPRRETGPSPFSLADPAVAAGFWRRRDSPR